MELSVWRATRVTLGDAIRVDAMKCGDSSGRVVWARLPDWPAMDIWNRWLAAGDVFVDVGANVGLYTLNAAALGCEVVAVEPAADMVERLQHHIALDGLSSVRMVRCAAMDRSGSVDLRGPDPNRRVASAVTDAGDAEATTLDEIIGGDPVRGMKIDVEGNERVVLQGAAGLLANEHLELIQLEWNRTSSGALGENREPVASLLHAHGFELYQVVGNGLVGPFAGCPPFGDDVFAARGAVPAFLRPWLLGHAATSQ